MEGFESAKKSLFCGFSFIRREPAPIRGWGDRIPAFVNQLELLMTDFSLEYVSRLCPELVKSEVEAVHSHVLDTHRPSDIYPDVVKAAARSLFPYTAAPADNVHFIDGTEKINKALDHLKHAYIWLSRVVKNDDIAQIQLDIECSIHYLATELAQMESKRERR